MKLRIRWPRGSRSESDGNRAPHSPNRVRLAVLGGLWAVVTGGALLAPGCYGRNCEGDIVRYGSEPGQGKMIDENTWESSPIDGDWLAYTHQRSYQFDIPALGGRTPTLVMPFLSPAQNPVKEAQSSTPGGGNLTEIYFTRPNGVDIKNGTCADYYMRVYIVVPPFPPGAPEAGAFDAGVTDASDDVADAGDD